ncbi:MAG: isoprenyl transferase [Bacteroidetes bacterium]|nr:isoprenyl transferase [Bacteroidota bacterium]
MSLKGQIDTDQLPKHIAIIMDGNGRWAKEKGKRRIFGHKNGVKAVREVTEAAAELGVPYLTLYAFSSENWNRPKAEVIALMELLVRTIRKEVKTLMENDVRLNAIGHLTDLPSRCHKELMEGIELTKDNKRTTLTLALSYGSRNEILDAVQQISKGIKDGSIDPEKLDETAFSNYLYTKNMPDPELLIRTSGEQRISNFLLWQLAYTELYFPTKFWPEYDREDLYKAILIFQQRERRFGQTSEQIKV